ncbi:MAG TPA: hypothetical protein VLT33_02945, partial [Labilithrix sp.]|nr:hypothetical protein [Labilithrix sp.]
MNAFPLSLRHTVACAVGMAFMTTLAACDKKSDGGTATNGASTSIPAAAAAGKKPKATLKLPDVQSAYKAEFDDLSKMKNPMEKKIDAFVAKIGKPAADSGRKRTWYALDGDKCT